MLAIIAQHNVSVDCAGVAKLLSKDGKEFTASAVANRVSRLKKMAKDGYVSCSLTGMGADN